MTYNNAAVTRRAVKRYAVAVIVGLLGAALSGCGANNGILGTDGVSADNKAVPLVPSKQPVRAKIAIAPIIGTPDKVSRQLTASLTQAINAQRIAVATEKGAPVDYTLRGYVVAVREGSSTKLSYIWDVTNPAGKRVNRISGGQTIQGSSNRDPWAAVSPAVVQTIADKTASSFGTWLPNKPAVPATPAIANAKSKPPATTLANGTGPAKSKTTPASGIGAKPQLAALKPAAKRGPILAFVPSITGAPGDGRVSLTTAMRNELKRSGIKLAPRASNAAYRILGKVAVNKAVGGQQKIKIDWHVKDPRGNALGTVSQNNKIPQGSLDGAWGETADAAAGAAAQGILKLLPKKTAVN